MKNNSTSHSTQPNPWMDPTHVHLWLHVQITKNNVTQNTYWSMQLNQHKGIGVASEPGLSSLFWIPTHLHILNKVEHSVQWVYCSVYCYLGTERNGADDVAVFLMARATASARLDCVFVGRVRTPRMIVLLCCSAPWWLITRCRWPPPGRTACMQSPSFIADSRPCRGTRTAGYSISVTVGYMVPSST